MATIREMIDAKLPSVGFAPHQIIALTEFIARDPTLMPMRAEMIERANAHQSVDAAFGAIKDRMKRGDSRRDFRIWLGGFEAAAALVQKAGKAIAMSDEQWKALRTAARFFIDAWDGHFPNDSLLDNCKIALLLVRSVVGTAGEEECTRSARVHNGG